MPGCITEVMKMGSEVGGWEVIGNPVPLVLHGTRSVIGNRYS